MVGIIKFEVKASSLIEVVTALVIISMVFSFAILIYLNVQRTSLSSKKLSYQIRIDQIYADLQMDKVNLVAKEYDFEDIVIYQEISKHPLSDALVLLHFEVRDLNGKLLAERKNLLYVTEEK